MGVRWLRWIARPVTVALLVAIVATGGCAGMRSAGHDVEASPPPPPPPSQIGGEQAIPDFPWPPPKPTSRTTLDRSLLVRGDQATLGEVARHLEGALSRVGYSERSYYTVPGGFALATRLEQITPDGTPKSDPQRWSTALPEQPVFSLGDYLRALFAAPQGDYRVIVFIVTNRAFATSARAATNEQAEAWLSGGLDRLPRSLQALPFDADVEASALVYQFRKSGHGDPPVALESSTASAASQLDRSGIVAALRR